MALSATLALAATSMAAPPEAKITHLPGWPEETPLPEMYSGYLPVGKTSGSLGKIHYWLILAQEKSETAPVVYWTNGGPGGSGINAGLLTEMGRIHLTESSNTTLVDNKFAWSNAANMLYVSQPKGVGFSYCEGGPDKCKNDDLSSAQDAYDFFVAFFEAYPEFQENDFYMTAESYGGIYIPTMMDQIDKHCSAGDKCPFKLKGAAIGDGCWGGMVGMCAFQTGKSHQISFEFFRGHAMVSQTLANEIDTHCGNFSDADVKKDECDDLLNRMSDELGQFDIYNIYDTCGGDGMARTIRQYRELLSTNTVTVTDATSPARHPQLATKTVGGAVNDYPCTGDSVSQWLSQPAVAKALHVTPNLGGMQYTWGPASYSGDLRPMYKRLIEKYRILIYSGDTDACVPYWGTEEWTRELGYSVKKGWRPWHSEHLSRPVAQRAGYVINYDTPTNFTFATIQGAGHLVPEYKPHFALTMLRNFLKGNDF